jgi:hypothetical protein
METETTKEIKSLIESLNSQYNTPQPTLVSQKSHVTPNLTLQTILGQNPQNQSNSFRSLVGFVADSITQIHEKVDDSLATQDKRIKELYELTAKTFEMNMKFSADLAKCVQLIRTANTKRKRKTTSMTNNNLAQLADAATAFESNITTERKTRLTPTEAQIEEAEEVILVEKPENSKRRKKTGTKGKPGRKKVIQKIKLFPNPNYTQLAFTEHDNVVTCISHPIFAVCPGAITGIPELERIMTAENGQELKLDPSVSSYFFYGVNGQEPISVVEFDMATKTTKRFGSESNVHLWLTNTSDFEVQKPSLLAREMFSYLKKFPSTKPTRAKKLSNKLLILHKIKTNMSILRGFAIRKGADLQ